MFTTVNCQLIDITNEFKSAFPLTHVSITRVSVGFSGTDVVLAAERRHYGCYSTAIESLSFLRGYGISVEKTLRANAKVLLSLNTEDVAETLDIFGDEATRDVLGLRPSTPDED